MSPRHLLLLVLFLLLPCLATGLAAQRTRADEFADQQLFNQSPPDLGLIYETLIEYLEPNGRYEGSGPPFPTPRPFYLPPHLAYIDAEYSSGSYQTGAGPDCVTKWFRCFITMTFDDGSVCNFIYEGHTQTCSDGSVENFLHITRGADAGPLGNVEDVYRFNGYTREDLQVQRQTKRIARAGRTVSFANAPSRPIVPGGSFEMLGGPGSTLDLRGNAAAGGPLFATGGPALLRCDFILMDPGVTLAALFSPPPIVMPGQLRSDVTLSVQPFAGLERLALDASLPADHRNTLQHTLGFVRNAVSGR